MSGHASRFDKTDTGILRYFPARSRVTATRAVFLDRDGVINRRIVGGYVTDWSEFEFLPGAVDAIAKLCALGDPIIVVSNQAGVGKGLVSGASLLDVTIRFVEEVQRQGGRIDAVYYCPHTADDGCECRKPRPGLLLQAQRDWGLDLAASVLIGDSASDAAAGRAVGCEVVRVGSSEAPVDLRAAAESVRARVRGGEGTTTA